MPVGITQDSNKPNRMIDPTLEMYDDVLEASTVYLLMTSDYRISRNRRAEWYFTHLNSIITVPRETNPGDAVQELQIISVIPTTPPAHWNSQTTHSFRYKVTCATVVTFLSGKYRIVYCLDVSPSVASVDVQAGIVMLDGMFEALKNSTSALMMPFYVPGSCFLFRPQIYITVIAHGSFLASIVEQVLVQGVLLEPGTYNSVLKMIFTKLHSIENSVADVTAYIHEMADKGVVEPKGDEGDDNAALASAMSPDFGLVDLLRQALIALNLLPENSTAGLIIMTDGVISVPDGGYLDMVLSQLRYNTVSCSFVQLSSPFHPHVCYGVIPYADLIRFISTATFGAYLTTVPKINESPSFPMNPYHEAFLIWSFQKPLTAGKMYKTNHPFAPSAVKPGEWSVRNKCFTSVRDMPIVKKQQYEVTLAVDYMKVLSSRLREGFVIKEVIQAAENKVHIVLSLSWKFLIQVEYVLTTTLPAQSKITCSVSIEGPYDFLHDVTCLAKKQFQSYYRQLLVSRFWSSQKHLSESDKLLVHFNSFSSSPAYYNIPDSLKNGVPLFYISSNTSVPVLQPSEFAHPQFVQFWKPVCLLDSSIWQTSWQKWMHTFPIRFILTPDTNFEYRHLHIPNSSGRYHVIQCRQTVMALNTLLKDWSSFVLVENHSYIKLMFNDNEKPPFSFCIIRITTKPPCMVLKLAFLVGTPGPLRNQTVTALLEKIAGITFPQRLNEPPKWQVPGRNVSSADPSPRALRKTWSDMPGCILIQKPIEKILIRYELVPRNFFRTLMPQHPYNTWASAKKSSNNQSTFGFRPTYSTPWGSHTDMGPEMFNTVARYLHHRRWIWCVQNASSCIPSMECLALILSTLTKMRLQEGLRFAFSSGGTINMVKELNMKITEEYKTEGQSCCSDETSHCVLQYVLFPPVSTLVCNTDEEDDESESDEGRPELYLVTECWVEPQCGKVYDDLDHSDLTNLRYFDIPDKLFGIDQECISTLLTFEHLSLMCQDKLASSPALAAKSENVRVKTDGEEQIKYIPFQFDFSRILPRSRQAEMLFSMFNQSLHVSFPVSVKPEGLDRANVILFNAWCSCVADLHDREVILGPSENKKIFHLITGRGRESCVYGNPINNSSQNFDLDNVNAYPKWRCFAKWISSSHIIATLFPASYLDLMILMLAADSLDKYNPNQAVQLLSDYSSNPGGGRGDLEISVLKNSQTSTTTSTPDRISIEPKSASICTRSDGQNYFFPITDKSLNERKRNRVKSGGELIGCAYKKSLIRKSSVDNLFLVKNFSEIQKKENQEKRFRKISLSRQHDCDLEFNRVPDSPYLSTNELPNFSLSNNSETGVPISDSKPNLMSEIYGSITLPVYVYDCSLSTLNDHIIFRSSSTEEDIYIDCRISGDVSKESMYGATEASFPPRNDKNTKIPPKHLSPEPKSDDSELTPSNKEILRSHCSALEAAFSKSYVLGLFESLQAKIFIQPNDVQVAISFCEETKVEVDLSEFIQTLCSHMKDAKQRYSRNAEESEESIPGFPFESSFNYDSCEDLEKIHEFIKTKFRNIILSTFHSVTDCPGIYYFKLDANHLKMVNRPKALDPKVKITSEADNNNKNGVLPSNVDLNPPEHVLPPPGLNTMESSGVEQETCFGALHNHEICTPEEDIVPVPILLYLTCNYKYENTDVSFLVHEMPTCLDEIMDALEIQELTPGAWDVLLKIEFVFLTIPKYVEKLDDESMPGNMKNDSTSSSCPPYQSINSRSNEESYIWSESNTTPELFPPVPPSQLHFVVRTIEDVKWLIRDEITSFKSEKVPVTEDCLLSVISHVEESVEKPGCQLLNIPLIFVNNSYPLGYEKFKERFQTMRAYGYELKENGSLYHLTSEKDTIFECLGRLSETKPGSNTSDLYQMDEADTVELESEDSKPNQTPSRKLSGQENSRRRQANAEFETGFLTTPCQLSERSSLITNEDGYDGDGSESGEGGTKSHASLRKFKCPPFWMIFSLTSEQVNIYFQCRYNENELDIFENSTHICKQIVKLICNLKRIVNQDLLLQQLHDTRQCSDLLEPESDEDNFTEGYSSRPELPPYEGHRLYSGVRTEDKSLGFGPGVFSCKVVWETKFVLHPRLRTGPGKSLMSRGIQTIKATLIAFEVMNRRNMFVYRDRSGNDFYLRLYRLEAKPAKLSSPTKCDEPEVVPNITTLDNESVEEYRLRRGSVSERELSNAHLNKDETNDEDVVLLQVCGITEAGEEIKEHLVQSLRNKLDDSVLDILSVMLDRNPHCKLTPDDVHFIQKPNTTADTTIKYHVNSYGQRYLSAFCYYLNQNLLQFSGVPRYMDFKVENHFQDYPNVAGDNDTSGKNLHLYNQSPGETGSRGIACLSVTIVNAFGEIMPTSNWCRPSGDGFTQTTDIEEMYSLIQAEEVENDLKDSDVVVEFRMWKQGRINVDLLKSYLSTAIKHTTWDLIMEFCFLTAPIACEDIYQRQLSLHPSRAYSIETTSDPTNRRQHNYMSSGLNMFETGEVGQLHPIYANSFRRWCELGSELNVSSLRMIPISLLHRQAVDLLAPEMESLINSVLLENLTKTFWQDKENRGYYTVNGLVAHSEAKRLEKRTLRNQFEMLDDNLQKLDGLEHLNEIEYPQDLLSIFQDTERYHPFDTDNECIIISRHLRSWKACVSSGDGFLFCPEEKSHYKYSPLLAGATHSPNFPGSTRSSFSKSDTLFPVLVPRQRLLMAIVTNSQVYYVCYNWSKESCDRLVELTKSCTLWMCARTSLSSSIFSQKSGIFYNQPITRNPPGLSEANPFTCGGMEVEALLGKPIPPKELNSRITFKKPKSPKLLAQFLDSFRNVKHQTTTLSIPGVINNNVKFLETQVLQLKSLDKAEIQQMLTQNWPVKGSSSSNTISFEAMYIFKQAARRIHFCMTPLLFLKRWRIEVATTRDNTIGTVKKPRHPSDSKKSHRNLKVDVERSRHDSGTSQKSLESTKRQRPSIWGLFSTSIPNEGKSQTGDSSLPGVASKSQNEKWHLTLCESFMEEYIQYIQTLGFVRIQCRHSLLKKRAVPKDINQERMRHISGASLLSTGSSQSGGSVQFPTFVNVGQRGRDISGGGEKMQYLQKALPGGTILFEMALCEPFFYVNIFALELERIQPRKSLKDANDQSLAFLEECDKMKDLMHLHSFTYDFHLRVSQSYICGRQQIFNQGYQITKFLDDFVKYYPKGPNFARNTVHTGIITVQNVSTPSHILYDYILSHEKLYNMKVVQMSATSETEVNEYILVQISTKKVVYNDKEDEKQSDEFDLTLLVAHDAPPLALHYSVDPSVLKLKYYIVLTSRQELYPKIGAQGLKGKLCVVNSPKSVNHPKNKSQLPELITLSRRDSVEDKGRRNSEDMEAALTNLEKEVRDMGYNHPYSGKIFYDGIREEMVHYMGYFSSHEQMMQQILNGQVAWVESHILEIVKMAAVDCRRDLLWQRLLVGGKIEDKQKSKREDLIARETVGALTYWEFGELLELTHVKSLSIMDPRVASLLRQPITFYQSLLRLITVGNQHSHRYFVAPDQSIHQMAIFTPSVSRSVVMLEINLEKRTSDLSVVFKELSEKEDENKPIVLETEILNLIESVINVCCYCSWANMV